MKNTQTRDIYSLVENLIKSGQPVPITESYDATHPLLWKALSRETALRAFKVSYDNNGLSVSNGTFDVTLKDKNGGGIEVYVKLGNRGNGYRNTIRGTLMQNYTKVSKALDTSNKDFSKAIMFAMLDDVVLEDLNRLLAAVSVTVADTPDHYYDGT